MRHNFHRILLPGAAIGLVTLLALPALASAFPGRGPGGFRGPGGGDGFMAGFFAEELDLSDAQREEIREIFEAARIEGEPLHEALEASREALTEATAAEPFDEGAVRAAAAQVGTITAEMAIHRAGVLSQVRSVLTPEQRQRAEELRQSMADWRDARQERGWRGHHRHHGF